MGKWLSWIKSNDKEIISIFNDLAGKAEESAKLLVELFANFDKVNENQAQIEKLEKEADKLTHSIFEELNKTFITPLDREDISRIASKTDDIIDFIDGIVGRIIGFKIKSPPPYMLEMAKEIEAPFMRLIRLPKMKNYGYSTIESQEETCFKYLRLWIMSFFVKSLESGQNIRSPEPRPRPLRCVSRSLMVNSSVT